MRPARTSVGLVAALAGAFLLFDPGERLRLLRDDLPRVAVVVLVLLAVAAVVQPLPYRAPAVLAGCFGVSAAVVLFGWPAVRRPELLGVLPVLAVVAGSVLVIGAPGHRGRHLSVLFPRRVRAAGGILDDRTRLVCALGGLYFDARSARLGGSATIRVWMLAAEVVVLVPREWRCELASADLRRVAVQEEGQVPPDGPVLTVEATGRLGRLVVRRS